MHMKYNYTKLQVREKIIYIIHLNNLNYQKNSKDQNQINIFSNNPPRMCGNS